MHYSLRCTAYRHGAQKQCVCVCVCVCVCEMNVQGGPKSNLSPQNNHDLTSRRRSEIFRRHSAQKWHEDVYTVSIKYCSMRDVVCGIVNYCARCCDKLKFHLARLDSTRLDTFDFFEPVEPVETSVSSETSRALPTWRTTNDLVQVYSFLCSCIHKFYLFHQIK